MKPIDFIQQHGVEKAREVVEGAPTRANWYQVKGKYSNDLYSCNHEIYGEAIMLSDLKRLVESVELVNSNGGWNGTKNTIKLYQSSLDLGLNHGVDGVDAETEIPRLKQAIADYEALYPFGGDQ